MLDWIEASQTVECCSYNWKEILVEWKMEHVSPLEKKNRKKKLKEIAEYKSADRREDKCYSTSSVYSAARFTCYVATSPEVCSVSKQLKIAKKMAYAQAFKC